MSAGWRCSARRSKSIRQGRVNLKESWAQIRGGEIWVEGMHISPYDQGNIFNRDPMRPKKLLMHKSEIRKLDGLVSRQGYTLVPLEIYLKDGRMKLQLGTIAAAKRNTTSATPSPSATLTATSAAHSGNTTSDLDAAFAHTIQNRANKLLAVTLPQKQHGSVRAEGVKGASGKPPVAPAGAKPPATKETKQHGSDRAEGFQRAIGKPFGRVRRRETLCHKRNQATKNY